MLCRSYPATVSAGLLVLLLGFWATSVRAGQLDVLVTGNGLPAVDAVASLHSVEAAAATKPAPAVIDQRDTQFTPRVSVVHVGSQIRFPNSDNVRHQVYSFSPAKRFQLPLYSGKPASPVLFDKPGVVELGCNIHDWMVAYVVVVDTPYHAITDKLGRASLSAPPGRYRLRIWHPDLEAGTPPWEGDVVIGVQASSQKVDLPLGNRIAPQQPADDKLRALQEKFRALKKHDR